MTSAERLDTSQHSLNTSRSKQRFTFSKADRFLPPVKPICDQSFYNLPNTRNHRTCSFGKGNKTEMALDRKDIPPPNQYTLEGDFDHTIMSKKRGFSFGFGREEVVGGPLEDTKRTKRLPGPGEYPNSSTLQTISTSIRSRLPDQSQKQILKIPGPGAYDLPASISASGNYVLSKFRNATCRMISPEGSSGRYHTVSKTPGPGQYTERGATIDPSGKYFLAKYHNSQVRSFSKSERKGLVIKSSKGIPGPGAQQIQMLIQRPFFGIRMTSNHSLIRFCLKFNSYPLLYKVTFTIQFPIFLLFISIIMETCGRLEIILGPVCSGKSSELIRKVRLFDISRKRCLVVKYPVDNGPKSEEVDFTKLKAKVIESRDLDTVLSINNTFDVVAIDDAHMFPSLQICQKLADSGKIVIVEGLDGDHQQKPYEKLLSLIPYCESVIKLSAICFICTEQAYFNQTQNVENKMKPVCKKCLSKK